MQAHIVKTTKHSNTMISIFRITITDFTFHRSILYDTGTLVIKFPLIFSLFYQWQWNQSQGPSSTNHSVGKISTQVTRRSGVIVYKSWYQKGCQLRLIMLNYTIDVLEANKRRKAEEFHKEDLVMVHPTYARTLVRDKKVRWFCGYTYARIDNLLGCLHKLKKEGWTI